MRRTGGMPPKPKFTKDEIIRCALDIVREKGIDRLTARELGAALGSSARPIFTLYESMDDLVKDVRCAAMSLFEDHVNPKACDIPIFKQIGMGMIGFGLNEPRLYNFLFMRELGENESFDALSLSLGGMFGRSVDALRADYGLSGSQAVRIFENVWIYTFGIGALCACGACKFSFDELSSMLTDEFCAILQYVKNNDKDEYSY